MRGVQTNMGGGFGREVAAAAAGRVGATWEAVVEAVGDVLRGSAVEAELVTVEEVMV